jgi:uncharacterized membrane protein
MRLTAGAWLAAIATHFTPDPFMSKLLLPYLAIVATMMVLDVIWIGGIARPLYQRGIGHLMAERPDFVAAVAFYLLFAAGVMAFVVLPRAPGAWQLAAAWGALFGFMTYMTYDLTNMATLRDWPLALSFIDTAWGCVATGLAATAGKLVADRVA